MDKSKINLLLWCGGVFLKELRSRDLIHSEKSEEIFNVLICEKLIEFMLQ